ncbi:GvpL/GvpF family gas vesicle protein [Puerhibacterium puerhi]|uniref:GvpL/GvpF family gas vesicle protein n=1 Tax=Puerhibacterium puerhi TaxID=2692623 RepID=UPI00135CEDEF|nr:GvpL/GvpF family gas vesicle protein [Puerhibacterium puerhi]
MSAAASPEIPGVGTGLYVYAVVAGAPADLGTGIDGAALDVVPAAGVAAVVHRHADGPYQGADDDVRRWIVEHSDVVDRLWQAGVPVLPMSFNVIVAAEEDGDSPADRDGDGPADGEGALDAGVATARRRLERWLGAHAADLRDRLEALRGRVELRVDVALDQHAVGQRDEATRAVRAELESRPPGVQRLLRRRLDRLERDAADALADELYPALRRRLAQVAEELTENRRARPEEGHVPVLTVSLLVAREAMPSVGRELAAVRDEQPAARIRYLGPWPPYSFADVPGIEAPGSEAPGIEAPGSEAPGSEAPGSEGPSNDLTEPSGKSDPSPRVET